MGEKLKQGESVTVFNRFTGEWILRTLYLDNNLLFMINEDIRLRDLRYWIGFNLMEGVSPRSPADKQLLGIIDMAVVSPKCVMPIPAFYHMSWLDRMKELSEDGKRKPYAAGTGTQG